MSRTIVAKSLMNDLPLILPVNRTLAIIMGGEPVPGSSR